jgi:hypothetical protein
VNKKFSIYCTPPLIKSKNDATVNEWENRMHDKTVIVSCLCPYTIFHYECSWVHEGRVDTNRAPGNERWHQGTRRGSDLLSSLNNRLPTMTASGTKVDWMSTIDRFTITCDATKGLQETLHEMGPHRSIPETKARVSVLTYVRSVETFEKAT